MSEWLPLMPVDQSHVSVLQVGRTFCVSWRGHDASTDAARMSWNNRFGGIKREQQQTSELKGKEAMGQQRGSQWLDFHTPRIQSDGDRTLFFFYKGWVLYAKDQQSWKHTCSKTYKKERPVATSVDRGRTSERPKVVVHRSCFYRCHCCANVGRHWSATQHEKKLARKTGPNTDARLQLSDEGRIIFFPYSPPDSSSSMCIYTCGCIDVYRDRYSFPMMSIVILSCYFFSSSCALLVWLRPPLLARSLMRAVKKPI